MSASARFPTNPDLTLASRVESTASWLASTAPGATLTSDSRRVAPGDVFFAYGALPGQLPGAGTDGRAYIGDAIARGAAAVLFDDEDFAWNANWLLPHYACRGLQSIAGLLAKRHYGAPDAGMFSVAVTGTNGKTSCTQWLGAALSRSGMPTAVIGTFGIGIFRAGMAADFSLTGYTTPDAVQLQAALANARGRGAMALAIEASSIGLRQQRLLGLHVDVAVFTNLTRDHLDYHGDMAAYETAKAALFDWPDLGHAVINFDDPMGARLLKHLRARTDSDQCAVRLVAYTLTAPNPTVTASLGAHGICLCATDIRSSHTGTQFRLHVVSAAAPVTMTVQTQLVGEFNVSNVLGVLGVLLAKGMDLGAAVAAVEALQSVPGRMQCMGGPGQPLAVIDYAHTPDALEKTLASLRGVARDRDGALWCVFGCGGDRDPGKRPQMGAIAQAADHVIVTSDNPRNESPAAIIADIVSGMSAGPAPQVIEDRATAILWALRHATKNDVVLLAGKGHENYQEIRGRKLQFLDADHAALALAARATMKGSA